MKKLLSGLVFLSSLFAFAGLPEKLDQFAGNYVLSDDLTPENNCPERISVTAQEKHLIVLSLDPQDNRVERYSHINKRRVRQSDDFGTWSDYRTRLTSPYKIVRQTRSCNGVVLISCGRWNSYSTIARTDNGELTITKNSYIVVLDSFPDGQCVYEREN